jgi:hypothetical protein
MFGFLKRRRAKKMVFEPIVRLVYERSTPHGSDGGVEPLIAVCATEEEAEELRKASAIRGRYASWEQHPLKSAVDRTTPLVDGETVHVVPLGDIDSENRDPIGIAVYADHAEAQQRASDELHKSGDLAYQAVTLPVGWQADFCP